MRNVVFGKVRIVERMWNILRRGIIFLMFYRLNIDIFSLSLYFVYILTGMLCVEQEKADREEGVYFWF